MEPILIALVCYVIGAGLRSTYAYLMKKLRDPSLPWDHTYTTSFIVSVILSMITALVTFSTFQVPAGSLAFVALFCIAQGYAMTDLVNTAIAPQEKKTSS